MLRKMVLNIGRVSVVLGLIMLFAALSSILLGRTLSSEAFGQFSLMRTLLLFIGALAVWGQDVAAARYFSRNGLQSFRWSGALKLTIGVGALLSVIGVLIATLIYHLHWAYSVALFIALVAYITTLFLSNLVRSQVRYTPAILMLNGFRGLFFVVALTIFVLKLDNAPVAIFAYYGIVILLALGNLRYAFRSLPHGDKPVPAEMHTTGFLFMGSQASVAIIGSLDSLFIPAVLDLPSLALYQAAVVPSQLFNILGRAGKYVWVPEFGSNRSLKLKRLSMLLASVGVLLLSVLIVYAKPLLHFLFDGKYDDGANILRILALAGTIRLFYNLASSIIIGRLQKEALYYHLGATMATMFVEIALLIFMLKRYNALGAALTVLIIIFLRTMASFAIIHKFKYQIKPTA